MRNILFICLFFPFILYGQQKLEKYGLKNPSENKTKKCKKYLRVYTTIPKEYKIGISVVDETIFIDFTHKEYLDLIFDKKWDGVVIEIVTSDQFGCDEKNHDADLKGFLMPPVFRKQMLENKIDRENGFVSIRYGELPKNFKSLDTEFNLLTIQNKYWCNYHHFINLEDNLWELLPMGLFKDTIERSTILKKYEEVVKKIRFTIPFEKNKIEFNQEDIKPIYDSLKLTDFNIQKIRIRAYSSIEGDEQRNKELQNGRASSIIEALQEYQTPEIQSEISISEAWNAFRRDIKGTKYEYLMKLSKDQVKIEVGKKYISKDLESYFKKHRRAEIELSLQKRFEYEEENQESLKILFNQKVKDRNLEEVLFLQQIILDKIEKNQLPEQFIDSLEVPKISIFGSLYNNFAIFGFSADESKEELKEQISVFKALSDQFPGNAKIKYNLTALKLKLWKYGESETNEADLQHSIRELKKLGFEQSLITRLQINYYNLLSYYLFKRQEFTKKDRVINEVFRSYKKLELNDTQIFIIAKYFASYSNYELANSVLENRIFESDVDSELIFYYLNLNINQLNRKHIQNVWMKALELDSERVCNLFLAIPKGGMSFQLSDRNFLDMIYCENCNN